MVFKAVFRDKNFYSLLITTIYISITFRMIKFTVSGSPRSGTTLLSAFLSNQDGVFVLNTPNVFFGKYNLYTIFKNENELKSYISSSLENLISRNEKYNLSESYYYNLSRFNEKLYNDIKYPVKLIDLYPKIISILGKDHTYKFLGISDDVLKSSEYYTFRNYLNKKSFYISYETRLYNVFRILHTHLSIKKKQ